MNKCDTAAFTPGDMRAIRLLALALGGITCVECVMAKNGEMLALSMGLNVGTMVLCPLAIYVLRRLRAT